MIFHSKKKVKRENECCSSNSSSSSSSSSSDLQAPLSSCGKEILHKQLNPEQQHAVDCLTSEDKNYGEVRLIARAGSGKTTVIAALCHELQHRNINYVVFNKSAKDHFFTRVDHNIIREKHNKLFVNTMHGHCLKWFNRSRKDTVSSGNNNSSTIFNVEYSINKDQIISALHVKDIVHRRINNTTSSTKKDISSEATWVTCCLLKSLENFTNSADKMVGERHICSQAKQSGLKENPRQAITTTAHTIDFTEFYTALPWVSLVQDIYEKSVDMEDSRIPVTHSTYQKCCQVESGQIVQSNTLSLKKRKTMTPPQKEVLIIDEAQDLNPCQMSIIKHQHQLFGASVVYVGDPSQSIYQFRGASRQFEIMV
jgi:superfamily I DNA/RNA helicase